MDFIDEKLATYIENHTSPENDVLKQLNRETWANVMMPRMLSGHLQGRFLSFISKLVQPDCVLEIGTYTGYSAICLAEGLKPGGTLHTIDINEELETISRKYFEKSGLNGKIIQHFGNALTLIPELTQTFDLVFIDADKESYPAYYDRVFEKVRPGGLIIADNVLWSGKVINSHELAKDRETQSIHLFNQKVVQDERVEVVMIPLRDGMLMVRKK